MRKPPSRDEDSQPTIAYGGPAVRAPSASSGSSSHGQTSPSDAPTLMNSDGTQSPLSPEDRRATPSRMPQPMLQSGTVLGQRYEILALLGEGGMGAVYKARDREVGQLVALKTIRPELASNHDAIERFKQELVLARRVTHQNVIRIYDLAEADGIKFITMEYVDGKDLRAVIHAGDKLSLQETIEVIRQTCHALEAAHNVGVIHRDLKPENMVRDKSGRILVMDFGLARTLEGTGMTQTGAMLGTLEYMSPEQALGQPLDCRSDIFTLGLIFYEMLIGTRPFAADSALASLIKRTRERIVPL